MAYKKILVGMDGSALAETALPHAQTLTFDETAEMILLRIFVNPAAKFAFSDLNPTNNLIQQMEVETPAYWQLARSKLQRAGIRISFLICERQPQKRSCGLRRWLLGSVADRAITHADLRMLLTRRKMG